MDFLSRFSFASVLLVVAIVAALPEKSPGEDRLTRVYELSCSVLAYNIHEEVVAELASLGNTIGESDSLVYDSLNRRLVARSTKEKLDQIETILAWENPPVAGAERKTQYLPERLRDPDAHYTGGLQGNIPVLLRPQQQGDGLDIILPEVNIAEVPLGEALARVEALCNEHAPGPPKRRFGIVLDAPDMIAKKPVTLHLVEVPASEAIRAAAEAASCQFFPFSGLALVSCIDLFPQESTSEYSLPPRGPKSLWLVALWQLNAAKRAATPATIGDRGHVRGGFKEALGTYASLAKAYPDFHPDLVWEKMRDIVERLAYE